MRRDSMWRSSCSTPACRSRTASQTRAIRDVRLYRRHHRPDQEVRLRAVAVVDPGGDHPRRARRVDTQQRPAADADATIGERDQRVSHTFAPIVELGDHHAPARRRSATRELTGATAPELIFQDTNDGSRPAVERHDARRHGVIRIGEYGNLARSDAASPEVADHSLERVFPIVDRQLDVVSLGRDSCLLDARLVRDDFDQVNDFLRCDLACEEELVGGWRFGRVVAEEFEGDAGHVPCGCPDARLDAQRLELLDRAGASAFDHCREMRVGAVGDTQSLCALGADRDVQPRGRVGARDDRHRHAGIE